MEMKLIRQYEDVSVSANVDLQVQMTKQELEKDVYEYTFALTWDKEQAKDAASKVTLMWYMPCVDVQYMWHPHARCRRVLDADWRLTDISSMLSGSAPATLLFNNADENTFTFAASECKKVLNVRFGVEEKRNAISGDITMGLRQFIGEDHTTLKVYADFRRLPYYQVLEAVAVWWDKVNDIVPMEVTAPAKIPNYNTWYSFQKQYKHDTLLAECKRAKALGLELLTIDDGWQGEEDCRGYALTGDWEPSPVKFADLTAFVQEIHDLDMKCIMWFPVAFVGYKAKNWERYKNKLLRTVDRINCGVLDPRYPDVREYIVSSVEYAMRTYKLDGVKIDFVDRFWLSHEVPVTPEMDYIDVQDATERLLGDIRARVQAVKADAIIEFRQKYTGPLMAKYCNMFRVGDCPSDIASNRVGITDLRLMSKHTAVHCDMLTWHPDEAVEDAALQVINSIFGVIQFSQQICLLPKSHQDMLAFWLGFAKANREVLLDSEFIPYEPHFMYPVIKAQNADTAIIGVYAGHKLVDVDLSRKNVKLINATKEEYLYLNMSKPCTADIVVTDTMGGLVRRETLSLGAGVAKLDIPRSGLAEITLRG